MNPIALPIVPFLIAAGDPARSNQETLSLGQPVPYQVTQRQGYLPGRAHEHEPGGPALGSAPVAITGAFPHTADELFHYRVVRLEGAYGQDKDWTGFAPARTGRRWSAVVEVPAGGWYPLEVRILARGCTVASAAVEPVGVGEVFLVPGQSYAEGRNDERTRVADSRGRVVAYDVIRKAWRVAHDPQPNLADGGTIWPGMGD